MRSLAPSAASFVLALAVLALAILAGAPVAGADWWDGLDRGERAGLGDLIAEPRRYRDRILTFPCVFDGKDAVFAPLDTPFNEVRHDNVFVWVDGAALWEREAFEAARFPFLYIEKTHPQRDELVGLERFTRIEVTGRIRAMVRGKPCVEVHSFRRTGHRLGKAVVLGVMAGDRYATQGDHELAWENYRRALQPDLPEAYGLLVRKRAAAALRKLGRDEEARRIEGGGILGAGEPPASPGGGPREGPSEGPGAGTPRSLLTGPEDLPGAPVASSPLAADADLPGTPVRVGPVAEDLPGVPAAPRPAGADGGADADAVGEAEAPAPPHASAEPRPRQPPPPAPPPSAPPARAPRLTGVK